jgi:hypothetical protein
MHVLRSECNWQIEEDNERPPVGKHVARMRHATLTPGQVSPHSYQLTSVPQQSNVLPCNAGGKYDQQQVPSRLHSTCTQLHSTCTQLHYLLDDPLRSNMQCISRGNSNWKPPCCEHSKADYVHAPAPAATLHEPRQTIFGQASTNICAHRTSSEVA